MQSFHPIVEKWFNQKFDSPTPPQKEGWPIIQANKNVLIAAPTGSGKTLTAFLVCIDTLVRQALSGHIEDVTQVVYVSPLKALSNDVKRNLETPLAEIGAVAKEMGYDLPPITVLVRTGDTPQYQRQKMLKSPPHILVTTPESLYLLLTSAKSQNILKTVETVIVDEIHALVRDKRGSHFSISLERLENHCTKRLTRIGLSATQKPIEEVAKFLVGFENGNSRECEIVNSGHQRDLDVEIAIPKSEVSAVCSYEQWDEVYEQIKELIESHRSTVVFVNTRKMAERVGLHLGKQLGEDVIMSHHGSLSKEKRLDAEEKLKTGQLKAIIATASLELGIDIGYVDLVIQVGSPNSIATFLQRVGRSGHAVGALPKGRLFALTRDELLEAQALLMCIQNGELDALEIPCNATDILAQQIVAMVAAKEEWKEGELFELIKTSYSYHTLTKELFDKVVEMLDEGYAENRKKYAYIQYDAINKVIKAKKHARLSAIMSGGAIPEHPLYRVINIDDGTFIGTIDEEFAVESSAGYVFQLGNNSWQLVNVRGTDVQVRDAHGAPPDIPFWFGEAPGRTVELSEAVSDLRETIGNLIELQENDPINGMESLKEIADHSPKAYQPAMDFLKTISKNEWGNIQIIHYIAVQKSSIGFVPTKSKIVYERFFDQTGGMQLVVHSPFGMRINKAWGLALRKSFCRSFDFELQAVADNNGVLLSMGNNQSFPIQQLFKFLKTDNVYGLLEQAILQVPIFKTRWQWNATRSLAVLRMNAGKKVPPALQRFRGDDLLTSIFPDATQCFEHITGDIELPNHPLAEQTMHDCMQEVMDLERLKVIVGKIENGEIELIAKETREPSPFCYSLINANPYAFLDDAEVAERRTRALHQRRSFSLDTFNELTKLDDEAIKVVREQAFPTIRDENELHEALYNFILYPAKWAKEWEGWFKKLVIENRAFSISVEGELFWAATERLMLVKALYPENKYALFDVLPDKLKVEWESVDARKKLLLGHLEVRPIVTAKDLAFDLRISEEMVTTTLLAIEANGDVIRGYFSDDIEEQWCHRRLLQRIHKLTLEGLRKQVKPVSVQQYMHFLMDFHGLTKASKREDVNGVATTLAQLEGFETAAGEWENEILPARIKQYNSNWLDTLCMQGKFTWARLHKMQRDENAKRLVSGMNRVVPIAFMSRGNMPYLVEHEDINEEELEHKSATIYKLLKGGGAQFAPDIENITGLFTSQIEESLGDLVRVGLVNADSFAAIRPFVSEKQKREQKRKRGMHGRFIEEPNYTNGGRWAVFPGPIREVSEEDKIAYWAGLLLRRYGVVFRDLLSRESAAPYWGDLVYWFRTLEARGEVRGGRFISGVSGEQFALPEVVPHLRTFRETKEEDWVVISVADPLNLIGVITDDAKISSSKNARLLLRNGKHIGTMQNGEVVFLEEQTQEAVNKFSQALKIMGPYREFLD